ncbi:Alkaline phosphatase synthesis transcriptional regulatory protein PhoP [Paraliobacillus sp. PM-2]|uniref:response regulator transcription factor n=1 Tax=Paraliobacillus sp. PM-2 TaxID=1462524 RepID=UPI00061B8D61|nr:response regulator [Paraliobacillus sp. PM-2]CQR47518.1 Alkaline phosphatase synthesis transcriptional regulatory protein PhoP [Paraliobacillus sp. PM-2]
MKKILLAEDEEVLRMLIVDTMEDEGYQIDEAVDGKEALEKIEEEDYDLLILDYMMPQVTGIEVVETIRKNPLKQEVKILMLSAKNQQFEQEKILDIGADYFMSKPFSPLGLLDKVEEIINEN